MARDDLVPVVPFLADVRDTGPRVVGGGVTGHVHLSAPHPGRARAARAACGSSTRRLLSRLGSLVIVAGAFALAALVALPSAALGNLAGTAAQSDSPAWLFNPLQVNAIELEASEAALSQLRADPTSYVDARITLHDGTTRYGPYAVGLKLKGHSTFRDLDGKAAFRIKFAYSVPKQEFLGLKGLTLNNMVQDPSMIAEAASSIMLTAIGLPASRVGYAYVRLNGEDYGLYANVETIDTVWAKRWFASTQHIYEANYTTDVIAGELDNFDVSSGSSKDISDLEALARAASGGAAGWSERMKPVADLAEMARVFAAEHYIGQWDGYSYGSQTWHPNNYDLHSDDEGRFSMIVTGTDQTWFDGPNFGLTGNGVLFRECLADAVCQPLYTAVLRQIAANKKVAGLPTSARAIRAVIAPWRARDPRREQSVAAGESDASDKIAFMAARPAVLDKWLGSGSSTAANLAKASAVRPLLGKPVGVPSTPVAGKQFTFSLSVTRSDTGAQFKAAKLVCHPFGWRHADRTHELVQERESTTVVRRPEDGEGQDPEGQDRGNGRGSNSPRHLHVHGSLILAKCAVSPQRHVIRVVNGWRRPPGIPATAPKITISPGQVFGDPMRATR